MVVTKLTWGKKNKDRVNVYIDEAYLFSLSYDLCIQEGLKKGMELSEEKIEELRGADTAQKVRQKALHLLSYRPHSQKELAQKLAKGRINPSLAQSAASYAADRGYQSDREYADMYVRHMTKKGLSNRRIGWELSQKGVSKEIVEESLHSAAGEEDRIRLVIEKKARRLPLQEKKEKDRIIQSLLRLGYSYDEISSVLSQYSAAGEEDV